MNRTRLTMAVTALTLMVLTALVIHRLHSGRKLGKPGVVVAQAPTDSGLEVVLPEKVLNYRSEKLGALPEELVALPKDTTYGRRFYQAPDGFPILVNVVLMGTDRTSIHRPEFCLTGQGWRIDKEKSELATLDLGSGRQLAFNKMLLDKDAAWQNADGTVSSAKGLYFFWFTADQVETPSQWQRMWWMAGDLLKSGTLQRWAYIACFTKCAPGQEAEAAQRLQEFMRAAVPQFQVSAMGGKDLQSYLHGAPVSTMLMASEAHTQQ